MSDIIEFDYSGLSKEVQKELMDCAESIRKKCGKHVESALAIGKELIHALAKLPDGARVAWLERECGVSKSAAYNYMAISKAFGEFPHCGNYEVSAMVALASNSTATKTSKKMASQGVLITNKVAKKLLDDKPNPPRIEAPKPASVVEDAEFTVVASEVEAASDESGEDDRKDAIGTKPKETSHRPPKGADSNGKEQPVDLGKCPVCAGTKFDDRSGTGLACSKCHHPHGCETGGDRDENDDKRASDQKAKTRKTIEALMRAYDDLAVMLPNPKEHDDAILACKSLLNKLKTWN